MKKKCQTNQRKYRNQVKEWRQKNNYDRAKAQALKEIRNRYPTEFKKIMEGLDGKNYKKKYRICEKKLKNNHRQEFLDCLKSKRRVKNEISRKDR